LPKQQSVGGRHAATPAANPAITQGFAVSPLPAPIRFLYLGVLKREAFDVPIPLPKQPQRIPQLLSRAEVARIIAACSDRKYQTMLMLCYGCGLRLSELVSLRVSDVDGEHGRLRIEQGKRGQGSAGTAAADAAVPLARLLARLSTPALAVPGACAGGKVFFRYTELSPDRFRGFWKD
jgi:integrase